MRKKKTSPIFSGHFPQKKLGQHFLRNQNAIEKIIQSARLDKTDIVLEIGPGHGALTIPLSYTAEHVIAVEKDPKLVEILQKRLDRENIPNVELINADILRIELGQLKVFPSKGGKVIGNLPYNISSPLLEKLIEHRQRIDKAILMFQVEFAQRLTASPGSRAYGSLSVITQYYARIAPLLQVGREDFYPKPKVGSMVIELDFKRPYHRRAENEALFKKTVRHAFLHKRKTLLNSLSGSEIPMTKEELKAILLKGNINPGRRAETLTLDECLYLESALTSSA